MKRSSWSLVLLGTVGGILFYWMFVMKLVARLAARLGRSAPCPAAVGWLVDNPLRRYYMQPVLGWTGIQPGEVVLELGPGPGVFTVPAAKKVGPQGRLVAVDIQPEMIARTQQHLHRAAVTNVELHLAGAYSLPLNDGSVDRAFLISVLPEVPNPTRALAELHRVLRPGGVLSITAEFPDPDYWFLSETIEQLEAAGFTLADSRPVAGRNRRAMRRDVRRLARLLPHLAPPSTRLVHLHAPWAEADCSPRAGIPGAALSGRLGLCHATSR